MHSRARF